MQGWIKLHREITEKAIWIESTPEQKTVLITVLMMANHKEKEWEWRGERFKAEPGQFVTSLPSIVKKCGKGITTQNVRTALRRFEKYEFLTDESTNRNRLITIVNWHVYQQEESQTNRVTNRQLTGNQQATNRQLTANKNDKNVKNEKEHIPYAEIVNYLNEKADKKFKSTTNKTKEQIRARWNEGHRLDDFKKVIDTCCSKWKGQIFSNGQKGDTYLQPSTLFNGKFDERLNWSMVKSEPSKPVKTKDEIEHEKMLKESGWFDD